MGARRLLRGLVLVGVLAGLVTWLRQRRAAVGQPGLNGAAGHRRGSFDTWPPVPRAPGAAPAAGPTV
jgi:hypothetical protein